MPGFGNRPERREVAMSGSEARVLLGLSHDARGRPFKSDEVGTEPGLKCRLLLESDSPQARSLEGRQLAMDFSLMFPDRSRLRLLNLRLQQAPRAGVTTSPLSSLAKETEGRMRRANWELEKWNTSQL
jgi:hypothetical protein